MLPRKNRIKKRKDFEKVFKGRFTTVGPFFILKHIKSGQGDVRCAFVFPVKQEKSAAKRNRVKRLFREAVRSIITNIEEGCEMIFIIRKRAKDVSYSEIKEEVIKVLNSSEIIKK